jgi:chromosome segregation ATPase
MSVTDSLRTSTSLVAASSNQSAVETWAKVAINKLKTSNLTEKGELQRLNQDLEKYLGDVKKLEALNRDLIAQVDRAKSAALPKLVDKSSFDLELDKVRVKLEDESIECVKHQARIEENESIIQHLNQRIKFFTNEADVQKQKLQSLLLQLNEFQAQREYLLRNAQMAEDDIKREESKIANAEKELEELRRALKNSRSDNKKIEFEIQTLLDELAFRKALFNEEANDLKMRQSGGGVLSAPDLSNFYKNELINAVRQIRQDFHTLSENQIREYKESKEFELAIMREQAEHDKILAEQARSRSEANKDLDVQSSKELRSSLDTSKSEMNQLSAKNNELMVRMHELENRVQELRERNFNELERKQAQIDLLKQQNDSYASELEYFDRVTRTKLESEIQTYRSILNSQLKLMQNSTAANYNYTSSSTNLGPSSRPISAATTTVSSISSSTGSSGTGLASIINEAKQTSGSGGSNAGSGNISSVSASSTIIRGGTSGANGSTSGSSASSTIINSSTNKVNSAPTGATNKSDAITILRQVFDHFDMDRSGKINSSELDKVLNQLNVKLTRDSYEQILREADKDR